MHRKFDHQFQWEIELRSPYRHSGAQPIKLKSEMTKLCTYGVPLGYQQLNHSADVKGNGNFLMINLFCRSCIKNEIELWTDNQEIEDSIPR